MTSATDSIDRLKSALADRYRIEREIGKGGMATVYLARDLKHDRPVALKVLHPELSPHGYHPDRFLREIRFVAGLTHPRILPLHDSDQCGGYLFYVMPYVEGETLRDRLRREKRLPVDEALRIARAVAGALDYAHRHDVLHRDVKPENVLMHEGQPLVTDFGIARAISACCDDFTEAGLAVGTPAYMSPEQASGDDELDGRSDIYGLGCMLYEMLTGQPPFEGSSARHTMAMHAVDAAPSVRSLRPDVPPAVEASLAKALAKDPRDRFASAAEFAGELDALRKAAASGAAGDGEVGVRVRSIAVLPFENLSSDPDSEYFSDGMTDELISALAKVKGLSVTSRTSAFALKGERRDVRSLGALLGVWAVIEGTVRQAGEKIRITVRLTDVTDGRHLWSERFDRRMDDVFTVQDEIAQRIVDELRRTMLRDIGEAIPMRYTESVEAYNLYLKGRFHWNRRSPEGIDEAIRLFEQALAIDPGFAPAYAGLADSHAIRTDYRGLHVAEGMERAKLEARKALELDDSLAEAHTSLAWITFIYEWDWQGAEREFQRAVDLNPGYATARQWYAWLHLALGRFDQAIDEARAALAVDPVSVSVRRSVGWIHYHAGNLEAALRHLKRAVEMDPTAAENQRVLGRAYLRKGKTDEARTAFVEAVTLSDRSAYALADLGYLHAVLDETAEARRILDALYATAEQHYVSPVAFVTLYVGLGDADEAFRWLHKAYEERRGWLAYINVEPVLEPLRSDTRFAELVGKMGLPPDP